MRKLLSSFFLFFLILANLSFINLSNVKAVTPSSALESKTSEDIAQGATVTIEEKKDKDSLMLRNIIAVLVLTTIISAGVSTYIHKKKKSDSEEIKPE